MARSIGMALENPQPVYRGVILSLYSGVHNHTLKTYTTAEGVEYLYHTARAYGPYGSKGPATSQVTSELRDHAARIKGEHYTHRHQFNSQTQRYDLVPSGGTVPQIVAFVESQVPSWNPIAGTERTA